jgi:hypothetical protein
VQQLRDGIAGLYQDAKVAFIEVPNTPQLLKILYLHELNAHPGGCHKESDTLFPLSLWQQIILVQLGLPQRMLNGVYCDELLKN